MGFLILTLYFQSTFLLLPHSTHVSLYLSHFRFGAFLRLSCSNSPSHRLIYQMELTFSSPFPIPCPDEWYIIHLSWQPPLHLIFYLFIIPHVRFLLSIPIAFIFVEIPIISGLYNCIRILNSGSKDSI